MKARDTLEATRAFGQMRKAFFNKHLLLRLRGGSDYEFGNAYDVFEGEALQRLASQLSETALRTPIIFTDCHCDSGIRTRRL